MSKLCFSLLVIMVAVIAVPSQAQPPPYYNFDSTGGANSFPFNVAAGKQVQWLVGAGEINRPSPVPSGHQITAIHFRANSSASPTFTNITVMLGQTSLTALPTGTVYTGPMSVVFFRASLNITSTAGTWITLPLDTPFPYDPSLSLVIDVQQCGMSGTGFTINQRAYTPTPRRTYLTSAPCPQAYSGQDGSVCAFGVTVVPMGTPGWTEQTSGVTTALNTVKAVSPTVAWAAGNGGVVLRTTNGGTNWTSVGGGAIGTAVIYNIEALSASTAFVTTSPSADFTHIFRTTNGGVSWDTVYTQNAPAQSPFINAIHMFDANNGIAQGDPVGGRWTVVRTTDGGATWVRDTVNAPLQQGGEYGANNGMKVLGTTHIWWTPGTGNGFYRSTDGGTTWNRVTLPASGFTAGVNFLNTQIGVVGNSGGAAARTTDGGATWSPITVGTTGAIYSVGAAGTLEFWATRGTTIQVSRDRGAAWSQDFSGAVGTFTHSNFVTSGNIVNGWAVTSSGRIYAYFNPVSIHDLGVQSLSKLTSVSAPNSASVPTDPPNREETDMADVVEPFDGDEPYSAITIIPHGPNAFSSLDTVAFRAIVKNFGTFNEPSYQFGWQVDGVNQTPISRGAIAAGASDTFSFQWNNAVTGVHTLRGWSILAGDGNPANDTATLAFSVGRVPGDTLYTFRIPSQIILGVAKMGSSDKLAFTSGGQVAGTTTADNKWIITDLYGTILDTTHFQINPTAGQGFGFRDLSWDGEWLLCGDDARLRRIDTTTFTEILAPVVTQTNPVRGIANQNRNRIWIANFTTNPIRVYDTTGAIVRDMGVPPVAPYGLGWDRWTDPRKAWLWYPQPSATGTTRLSKVDTSNGAIVQTFDYTAMTPTTTVGGFDIINDHPDYPGAVIGFMINQGFPNSSVFAIYLGEDSTVVNVPPSEQNVPQTITLYQNYPNPFNPSTTIRFAVPVQANVTVRILNVLGQEVRMLVQGDYQPGYYDVVWDGKTSTGNTISSGMYFYQISVNDLNGRQLYLERKKMVLLK